MIRENEPEIYIDQMTINTQVAGKPLFLTVAKAAIETGYSESCIGKLIQKGVLPHFTGEGNNGRMLIRTDVSVGLFRHAIREGWITPATESCRGGFKYVIRPRDMERLRSHGVDNMRWLHKHRPGLHRHLVNQALAQGGVCLEVTMSEALVARLHFLEGSIAELFDPALSMAIDRVTVELEALQFDTGGIDDDQ